MPSPLGMRRNTPHTDGQYTRFPPARSDAALAVYLPVWKSGSQFILSALRESVEHRGHAHDRGLWISGMGGLGLDGISGQHGLPERQFTRLEDLLGTSATFFTFVREPLEHLLSGIYESLAETYRACCSGIDSNAPPPERCGKCGLVDEATRKSACSVGFANSTRTADEFWLHLLSADARALKASLACFTTFHYSSQLQVFWALPRVDFVGRLETLEADWTTLAQRTHGVLKPFRSLSAGTFGSKTHHGGDTDHYAHLRRTRLREALQRNESLRKGVKALLSPDYRCLGYPLPDALQGERKEKKGLRWT